ncbi:protein phosphatase 1 regulatory subunit 27 isoform 1-T1 [Theristicus caerulescens]
MLHHLKEGIYAVEGEQKPVAAPLASAVFVSFPKLISLITRVCWHPSFLGCGQLALVTSAFRDSSPGPMLTNPFLPGMAALHEAVLTGNLDCVKLLVKYGADIHQKDENGWTPLHMACSDGYADIARYLISLGASLEATTDAGEKPSDLIDPEYKDLVELFQATTMD